MTNILVTGAGGPAGVAVVRALVGSGELVVAVDADPLAAGLGLAHHHAVVCAATERDRFVAELAQVARQHSVDMIISTVSEEMLVLAGREHELDVPVWLPKRRAVAACVDKWRFWKIAEHANIPAAASALGNGCGEEIAANLPGPWVVKPRFDGGARNAYAVDDPAELAWACRRVIDPIVQTRPSGREFTVDLLADHAGRLAGAVPRWRLETRAGISTKGRTFCDALVTGIAARCAAVYSLTGAANLQGFVTDDAAVVVTQVNPRFSAGLSLSLTAGADLVGEFVRGTLGMSVRPERLQFRPDVTMVRNDTELFAA